MTHWGDSVYGWEDPYLRYSGSKGSAWTPYRKYGANLDVGTAYEDVWTEGGNYTGWIAPGNAAVVSISSASTDDAAAGSGARTVFVQGLNANWELQSEVVSLNGTTPVTTANTYIRCWRLLCTTFGTYGGSNVGKITATIGGATVATVEVGFGATQLALFTVPAGYTAYVTAVRVSALSTKASDFIYNIRYNADQSDSGFILTGRTEGVIGAVNITLKQPVVLPAKTDISIRSSSEAGSGDVAAAFDMMLAN